MGRPPKPLIKHDAVVTASLKIIDAEGLESFSMPRLAHELGVRSPSLYHHYADRRDVLAAVARHIAGTSVMIPDVPPGPQWPEYFVALAVNFRESVLRHPNAVPVLLEYMPRETLVTGYEDAARYLAESGVPTRLHLKILVGVESLSLGAVFAGAQHHSGDGGVVFPAAEPYTHLGGAVAANRFTADDLYAAHMRCFLLGVLHDGELEDSRATA